jgi:hypothetical protein
MVGTTRSYKKYDDIDEIKDVDGVVAVITQSRQNGTLAVGFFKEYDPGDGEGPQRTTFLREAQLNALQRLVPQVKDRMALIRAQTGGKDH